MRTQRVLRSNAPPSTRPSDGQSFATFRPLSLGGSSLLFLTSRGGTKGSTHDFSLVARFERNIGPTHDHLEASLLRLPAHCEEHKAQLKNRWVLWPMHSFTCTISQHNTLERRALRAGALVHRASAAARSHAPERRRLGAGDALGHTQLPARRLSIHPPCSPLGGIASDARTSHAAQEHGLLTHTPSRSTTSPRAPSSPICSRLTSSSTS